MMKHEKFGNLSNVGIADSTECEGQDGVKNSL